MQKGYGRTKRIDTDCEVKYLKGDYGELTKGLKQENRKRVKALEGGSGEKYILRFDVDGLKLQDVENMLKDIRKNVPKSYNKKRVYVQLDGAVNFG